MNCLGCGHEANHYAKLQDGSYPVCGVLIGGTHPLNDACLCQPWDREIARLNDDITTVNAKLAKANEKLEALLDISKGFARLAVHQNCFPVDLRDAATCSCGLRLLLAQLAEMARNMEVAP